MRSFYFTRSIYIHYPIVNVGSDLMFGPIGQIHHASTPFEAAGGESFLGFTLQAQTELVSG